MAIQQGLIVEVTGLGWPIQGPDRRQDRIPDASVTGTDQGEFPDPKEVLERSA